MDKNQVAQRQQRKEIYSFANEGQFYRVVHLLELTNLSKESTLNVFISVSRACSTNIEKCELDVLETLTNKLVLGLNNLTEDETVTYVLSVFHIFQSLCRKERYVELSKMQEVICPTFTNTFKAIKKAEEYYDLIIQQLICSMQQLANAKEAKYNQYLLVLIKTLFKARNIIWNNPENFYYLVGKCYNQLLDLHVTSNQLFKFYTNILEELADAFDKTNAQTEEVLILFLPLFFEICTFPNSNFEHYMVELNKLLLFVRTNFKHEQYFYCHSMIDVVTGLFPTKIEEFPEKVMDIGKTLNTFKASHTKLFYNVISFLNAPLSKAFEYYMVTDQQKFIKLSDNVILNVVKFFFEEIISQSLMSFKECSCGCSTKKNNKGFRLGLMLVELLIPYIKHLKTLSEELLIQITKWLGFLYDFLKEIKDHDCKKWSLWCSNLTQQAYRISVILDSAKNKYSEGIIKCYLKNSLPIEGSRSGGTEKRSETEKIHVFGILALCRLESERKNWLESMGFVALHCLLYTQHSGFIFHNQWILLKIKMKEDTNLQQQTLVSILCKQCKQLSEFLNIDGLLTKSKQIELLMFELSRYKAVWKSRTSMTAAFENICKIADPSTIADVILQIYGAGDVKMSESTLLFNAKIMLEKNKTRDANLALAVIKFYQYKNIRNELTNRTVEQMKNKNVKRSETMEPIPKDQDDECDIVSVYSHLRLVEFVKVLNLLDSCLASIQSFIDATLDKEVLKNLIKLLATIGLEYKLHYFLIKSIQAFEISMKFARELKATEDQLFALSNIIEMADEKSSMVKDLIVEGDLLVRQLERVCDKDQKNSLNEMITYFYICKSKALLYEDPHESNEAWKKADVSCELSGNKGHLRAELYVISYKLTSNNCNFLEHDHIQEPGTYKLHRAYEIFADLMYNTVINNSEICTLFSVVEELAKVYHQMRQPRELRNYSRNSVILAQKLNLPLRCVSLLLLLAHADITTNELNDAEVKLDGIDDIFSICNSDFALEVPQHFRQYSPSSPTQAVKSFTLPKFLYHKQACVCFMCLNWQFQKLYLAKCNAHALINIYRDEKSIVEDYANGAIKLYQIFYKNMDKFINKASMLISNGLVPDFIETFVDTLAFGLYEYVFYLLRNKKIHKAKKMNEILVALLEPLKHKYAHLYKEALLQTLTYLIADINLPIPGIVTDITENEQKLKPPKQQLLLARTPVSKKLPVVVSVNESEIYSPQKERPKTKVNLFFSEKDVEESDHELPATKNNEEDHQFPEQTAWGNSVTPATPLLKPVELFPSPEEFSGQTPHSHKRSVRTLTSEKLNPRRPDAIPKFKIFTYETPKPKNLRDKFDCAPNAPPVSSVRKRVPKMLTSDDLGVKRLEEDFNELLLTDNVPKSVKKYASKQGSTGDLETSAQSQPSIRKRNTKISTSNDLGVKRLADEIPLTDVKKYSSKQSINKDLESATSAHAQSKSSVRKRNTKMSTSDDLGVKRLEDELNELPLTDFPKSVKKYSSKQSINKDLETATNAQGSVRKRNTKMSSSDDLERLEEDLNQLTLFTVPKSVRKCGSKQSININTSAASQLVPVQKRVTKNLKNELEVKSPKYSLKENLPGSSKMIQTVKRSYKTKETTKKSTTDLSDREDASVQNQPETGSKNTRKQLLSRKIKEKLNRENSGKEKNSTTTASEKMENLTPKVSPCKMSRV